MENYDKLENDLDKIAKARDRKKKKKMKVSGKDVIKLKMIIAKKSS